MSQSNYKAEALELFRHIRANKISDNDALSAVDRLNASTIGEDETLDDCPIEKHLCPKVDRNQLRSELRQKFGVVNTDINVGIKKEE